MVAAAPSLSLLFFPLHRAQKGCGRTEDVVPALTATKWMPQTGEAGLSPICQQHKVEGGVTWWWKQMLKTSIQY